MRRLPLVIPTLTLGVLLLPARSGAAQTPPPAVTEGPSNTSVGQGALVSTTTGSFNTAVGAEALSTNVDGGANTATGYAALRANVAGQANTALGASAMAQNTFGNANTAVGDSALYSNTDGIDNVAVGSASLYANSVGVANTAIGGGALSQAAGHHNTGVGFGAGSSVTTGVYNVYLGATLAGDAADTNTMRLGRPYDGATGAGQNRTFIAGVAGTVLANPAVPVYIDSTGQLGTLVPAPFSGPISQPVHFSQLRPDAAAARLAALEDVVRTQQAALEELRQQIQRLSAPARAGGRK